MASAMYFELNSISLDRLIMHNKINFLQIYRTVELLRNWLEVLESWIYLLFGFGHWDEIPTEN